MNLIIRKIEPKDNPHIATVIRNSLEEFGANKPGTVFFDKETDHLSTVFNKKNCIYYICTLENKVIGGAGIYTTEGLPDDAAELVKIYLAPEARGKGYGARLMNQCIDFAKQNNFKNIYLESMPELDSAIGMYKKFNFEHLDGPMGNSGHYGCTIWMLKKL